MALPDIIGYFRDCYQADNARTTLWNIFHASVEHRLFAEPEEELLNGFLPYTSIDAEQGLAVKKAAYVYRKEKELVYCSLFVVGWLKSRDPEPHAICAPLIIHPADIVELDPHVFLKPDLDQRRLNHPLLDSLQDLAGETPLSQPLAEELGNRFITFDEIASLAELLQELLPKLDVSKLHDYPKLVTERELRNIFSAIKDNPGAPLRVLPSSVAAVVKKSVETRGVLNELSEIAQSESVSTPMGVLFEVQPSAPTVSSAASVGRVPAILSRAQRQILELAATNALTLVIGPPGTGKSFTIATLAMEHLTRGQSVLVASKMDHAVDVIFTKIEQQLGIQGCVIRAGRKQYLKDLKNYLQQLLSGMYTAEPVERTALVQLKRELAGLDRSIDKLERSITRRTGQELSWGRFLAAERTEFLQSLRTQYVRWRVKRSRTLWSLFDELDRQLQERIHKTTLLIQLLNRRRLSESLSKYRREFTTFLKAIRARTGGRQEDLFKSIDFKILFSAFPVWLVNLADIHEVLPLKKELFDLAIIDEATQCDIASCLPVFQRAKRVVITGDPNQLRHISFISKNEQRTLLEKHEIPPTKADLYDYREKSILDFINETVSSQGRVIFLNEHYRSAPAIIGFSNATFYGGALHVMTEKPGELTSSPLTLRYADGHRSISGENLEEARLLIEAVVRQVELEKSLGSELCHSLGILSPFRSQVDHISAQLTAMLPWEVFEKHEILIGTAHGFQGEERDIMFLSLAVDSKCHPATMRFLDRPDVFNVSITRARVAQHVYVSQDPAHVKPESLLGTYLRYIKQANSNQAEPANNSSQRQPDAFQTEVEQELVRRGFKTWSAYPVAGLTMDIVVVHDTGSFGVDLIGYPGAFELAFPLERYKMFQRAGLKIFPLSYSRWVLSRDECLRAMERMARN